MISRSIEETRHIAEKFLSELSEKADRKKTATVIGLSGDLGSGKTAFTQQIGNLLGIKDQIVSPTFVIEKIYKTDTTVFTHLVHIDAYRIESEDELGAIGFKEILASPGNLVFIEWPQKIAGALPEDMLAISFSHKDNEDNVREISF